MSRIILVFLLRFFFLTETPPEVILPYQNTNQLILLFAASNRSADYEQMLLEFSRDPLGLDQRDLVIFEIFQSGGLLPDGSSLSDEDTRELREYFNVENGSFAVVVVDKNLQEVYRTGKPVTVKEIFGEID
jgi:hypothetical protein